MGKTATQKADLKIGGSSVSMVMVMFADFDLPMGNATMGIPLGKTKTKKTYLKIGVSSVSMVMVFVADC